MSLPDIEQFADLIGSLYAAALDPELWQRFLVRLAGSFGTDKALILNADSAPGSGGLVVTTGLDMSVVSQWEGSKEHTDLWYQATSTANHHMPYFGTELCAQSKLRKSAFYVDTLKPLGVEYSLGAVTVETQARNWVVSVYSGRAGEFNAEQKAYYQLLIPHIERAMFIRRQLAHHQSHGVALAEALNRSPFGVAILGENQRVTWLNRKADVAFEQGDGIRVRYGELSLWDYGSQRALNHALQQARAVEGHACGHPDWLVEVVRPSRKSPYHLLICPLPTNLQPCLGVENNAWLVLIHDPEEPKVLSEELICKLYGLSKAEAKLCVYLVRAGSIPSAIDQMHISRNTAKTHLRRIFEKLHVSSQAELLLALSGEFILTSETADFAPRS